MKKEGYTLSELLVVMTIVGFIAVILLPQLKNIFPNDDMLKFKKAYYITERVVSELINDEDLYPAIEPDENIKDFLGNHSAVDYRGTHYEGGETKFCGLFAAKLNKTSDVNCVKDLTFIDNVAPTEVTLATSDGINWILPITKFEDENTPQVITLDVNGKKAANCYYNKTTCPKPDRFNINIYQDGRISVDDDMAKEYLNRANITKHAKNETIED